MKHIGLLIIVPTPIGNLDDMTQRSLRALENADVILAEDTRVTGKLLNALGIKKPLERLDENVMSVRAPQVIERIKEGERIAYCSDAGMPGVSDPGLRLVRFAIEANIPYEVLPGASAALVAYVASGTENTHFYFGGFFPRKDSERIALLTQLSVLDAALVFYESPHRIIKTVACIAQQLPHRRLSVCRELTKLHEEIICGTSAQVHAELIEREERGALKGEIVIVIDGPSPLEKGALTTKSEEAAKDLAATLATTGERSKSIAKQLVKELGISRNAAYEIAMDATKLRGE